MKYLLGSSSWRYLQTAKLAWLLGLLYRCVHCGWAEHETTYYSSLQYAKLTSPQVSLQLSSKTIRPVSKRSWVGLSRNSQGRDNLYNVTSITALRKTFYGWVQRANGDFSEITKKVQLWDVFRNFWKKVSGKFQFYSILLQTCWVLRPEIPPHEKQHNPYDNYINWQLWKGGHYG